MFAEVNGVRLEYDVTGSGPDLVWLHGLGGNLELERRTAEALAAHYRVLWYSSRGHGRSDGPPRRSGWSYHELAADLDGLISTTGMVRPLLVGGSHGANTILAHLIGFPARASGAILLAPGGNALGPPAFPRLAAMWLALQLARLRGHDGLIRFITGQGPDTPDVDPLLLAAARTHDRRRLYAALRRVPLQRVGALQSLASVTTPTVVAAWAGDPIVHPIALAQRLADAIPAATFEEIPNLLELPNDEVVASLVERVRGWSDVLAVGG